MWVGIQVSGNNPESSSDNNKIIKNTITEVLWVGISVGGYTANNLIKGNEINVDTWPDMDWYIAAIELYNVGEESGCNNNIVQNNQCNTNYPPGYTESYGIFLAGGVLNNTIGPNNVCNYNGYGIYLDENTIGNHVFNNTALYNTEWDIYNLGTGNTFKNNEAEKTYGF